MAGGTAPYGAPMVGAAPGSARALVTLLERGRALSRRAPWLRSHAERQRLEILYDVTAAGEHRDLDVAAQAVADALAPALGDWSLVALVGRDEEIEFLAVAGPGGSTDDAVREMLRHYPIHLDARAGIGSSLRTGDRLVYGDLTDELLAHAATDAAHLAALRSLGLGAAVIEPLTVRGRRVGALACVTRRGRPLRPRSLGLLGEVASHAAAVLENARLHGDLTERDRALRFSEALLRAQSEAGIEGQLVVGADGTMLSTNARFAEMWGFTADELRARSDDDALAAAMERVVDPEAFIAKVRDAYANPERPTRDEIHFNDGRVFDRYGAPMRLDDGTYVGWAWYFRDITAEREVQRSLAESGERFAALARTLQESLLPPELPDIPSLHVAARFHPAGDGSEIGGDFYDLFQTAEHEWCALVGDVCGKGAPAARLTALARYTFRAAAIRSRSMAANLTALNEALVRQAEQDRQRGEHRFVTLTALRMHLDGTEVTVEAGSAGHPPPLHVTASGTVTPLACRGTMLGMFEEIRVEPARVVLEAGDSLVLYTDGVLEARRGREEFGEDRLVDVLRIRGRAGGDAADLASAVEDEVLAFQDGMARDDIAIVVVQASASPA